VSAAICLTGSPGKGEMTSTLLTVFRHCFFKRVALAAAPDAVRSVVLCLLAGNRREPDGRLMAAGLGGLEEWLP
jgi:hypothetical protein